MSCTPSRRPRTDVEDIGFTMEIFVLPAHENLGRCILKYCAFEQQFHSRVFKELLAKDNPHIFHMGNTQDRARPLKIIHYMFERPGGIHFRYFEQPSTSRGARAAGSHRDAAR